MKGIVKNMGVVDKVKNCPWRVVTIGDKEYCFNTHYSVCMTEIKPNQQMVGPGQNQFIKGVYSIMGIQIPIIEGRKLVDSDSIDSIKIQISQELSDLRFKYDAWANELEWCFRTGDSFTASLDADSNDLMQYIKSRSSDERIPLKARHLLDKMREPNKIIYTLTGKILTQKEGQFNFIEDKEYCKKILKEIRREVDRYILTALDNICKLLVEDVSVTVITIKCNNKVFGLLVDFVECVAAHTGEISLESQDKLSSGKVNIRGRMYSILDLTKISRLV